MTEVTLSNLASSNPHQDIHKLFESFNKQFFYERLVGVEVRWSLRMTRCAGLCVYRKSQNYCSVRLSAPLLKLRPHSDLVDTMLHEMIHAYLFVTQNDNRRDGHGPRFHEHKDRINKEAGTNITVYHSFLDEIKLYKQHWWRCNGKCQNEPPYFGMVKRSMNRAPGHYEFWWERHQQNCGGIFTKIREPIEYTLKKAAKEGKQVAGSKTIRDITNTCDNLLPTAVTDSTKGPTVTLSNEKYGLENIVGFVDLTNSIITGPSASSKPKHNNDLLVEIDLTDEPLMKPEEIDNRSDVICKCPVCNKNLNRIDMKEHLEVCEGLQGVFDDNEDYLSDVFYDKEIEENNKTQQLCAICALPVEGDMKNHIDYCLNNSGLVNIFDEPTSEISEANSPSELNTTASEASFEFNLNNNDDTKLHSSINKYFSLNASTDLCQSVKSVCNQHTKRRQNIDFTEKQPKKLKKMYNRTYVMCKCPVCKKNLNQVDMEEHLKVCEELQGVFDLTVFDDKQIKENNNNDLTKPDSPKNKDFSFNSSTDSCPSVKSKSEQHVHTDGTHNSTNKDCSVLKNCPICISPISDIMRSHIEDCLNNSGLLDHFKEPTSPTNNTPRNPRTKETHTIEISESDDESPLEVCSARFRVPKAIRPTIPKPIFTPGDDSVVPIESATYHKPTEILPVCPVCGKQVKGDINFHVEDCLNTSGVLDEPVIEISDNDSPVALINPIKFPKPMVLPNKKNEPEVIMISDSDSVMICDNVTKVPKPIMLSDRNSESETRVVCRVCGMRFGVSRFNSHTCY